MRRIILVLAAILAACSKDRNNPTGPETVAPTTSTDTLYVEVGPGISGSPSSGRYPHPRGSPVSYSYSPQAGYREPVVALDDELVAGSGTILMNGGKRLFITTEKIPVVILSDAPVAEAALETLTHPDSASFQAYIDETMRALASVPTEDAIARLTAVNEHVFRSATFAQIKAFEMALSGKIFAIGTVASPLPVQAAVCDIKGWFVNGISTSLDNAVVGVLETLRLIREAGLPCAVPLYLFYNSSAYREMQENWHCIMNWPCALGNVVDYADAARELLLVLSRLDKTGETEAEAFARIIQSDCRDGKQSLIIAHSQGTLIANLALRELESDNECAAVISLASPTGTTGWNLPTNHLSCFVATGDSVPDIITRLGTNDCPRLVTARGREADSALAKDRFLAGLSRMAQELNVHRYSGYVAAPESRAAIKSKVAEFGRMLQARADSIHTTATGTRIYASSFTELWLVDVSPLGKDSLIAKFREPSGATLEITDIARAPNGEVWAASEYNVYRDAVANGKLSRWMSTAGISGANALAFESANRFFFAGSNGIMGVEIKDSAPRAYFAATLYSDNYLSGDLAYDPIRKRLYLTTTSGSGNDHLLEFDPTTSKLTTLCQSIGFGQVWGLALVGSELYGFTANKEIIRINPITCTAVKVRDLSFIPTGAG